MSEDSFAESLAHGQLLAQQGDFTAAIDVFRRLLTLPRSEPLVDLELGYALKDSGLYDEAGQVLNDALTRYPGHMRLLNAYGLLMSDIGRHDAALDAFDKATLVAADHPGVRSNRARTLLALGRAAEAIEEARAALSLDQQLAPALQTLITALFRNGKADEALALCNRIVCTANHSSSWMVLKATALEELGRFPEALPVWRAQAEFSGSPKAWFNAAIAALRLGDYRLGWTFWAHRPESKTLRIRDVEQWRGDRSIAGKSLFVYPEQGFGDCIQFIRYLPRLIELKPGFVTLGLPAPLEEIYQGIPGVRLVRQGESIEKPDCQLSLASLPSALLHATGDASIPVSLKPPNLDQSKILSIEQELGPRDRLRIGLAVSGNADHQNDLNRSIPLKLFASLAALDIDLILLQIALRESDRAPARAMQIRSLREPLRTFSDTAALISVCDLVISVDSAPAHLAASLGAATMILLPHVADWRWGIESTNSVWYPSASLRRQDAGRDWTSVVSTLVLEMSERVPRHRPAA
jgi:tetratricopeptide (TPR) repeat protein